MNEKKLASGLARGDTAALGKVIEAYSSYVRTVAYNFSRGALTNEDIEEVISDVFYKLWNAREKLDCNTGLRSYLSAIARNTVCDRLKKRPPLAEDISALEIPSDMLIEETAEVNEIMKCLYEGLKKLPKDEQEIFFRYYFNGDTAARIADSLKTTKSAVDVKLHRIRKKLRKYLAERGYDHV